MIPCLNCGSPLQGMVIDENRNLCNPCIFTAMMAALELHNFRTERFERETHSWNRKLWRKVRDTFFYRPMR